VRSVGFDGALQLLDEHVSRLLRLVSSLLRGFGPVLRLDGRRACLCARGLRIALARLASHLLTLFVADIIEELEARACEARAVPCARVAHRRAHDLQVVVQEQKHDWTPQHFMPAAVPPTTSAKPLKGRAAAIPGT
jgi:hypothetical protein